MSGIGFQKLQGQGTSAYQQLQKTSEVLEKLEEMRFPDIRKLAIEFFPNADLIPVTRTWNLRSYSPNNVTPKIENLQFDGQYFGYFTVSLTTLLHADNPGLRELSELGLFNGSDALTKISVAKHGNDEGPYSVSPIQIIGKADRMNLYSITADSYGIVSFIGYKVGEPIIVDPEPLINGISYLSPTGNDSFAIVNDDTKPFLTANAALIALESYENKKLIVGIGSFDSPSKDNIYNGLVIEGLLKPVFDDNINPTQLINGSVFKNSLLIDKDNVTVKNIGIDCGFLNGVHQNGLVVFGKYNGSGYQSYSSGFKGQNIISLCFSYNSPYHGFIFEHTKNINCENLTTAYAVHGIAIKAKDCVFNNLNTYANEWDGLIIKSDDSNNDTSNITINGYKHVIKGIVPTLKTIIIQQDGGILDNIIITNADVVESNYKKMGFPTNISIKSTLGVDITPDQ